MGVGLAVGAGVGVSVAVGRGVEVAVGLGEAVEVGRGVGMGDGSLQETTAADRTDRDSSANLADIKEKPPSGVWASQLRLSTCAGRKGA